MTAASLVDHFHALKKDVVVRRYVSLPGGLRHHRSVLVGWASLFSDHQLDYQCRCCHLPERVDAAGLCHHGILGRVDSGFRAGHDVVRQSCRYQDLGFDKDHLYGHRADAVLEAVLQGYLGPRNLHPLAVVEVDGGGLGEVRVQFRPHLLLGLRRSENHKMRLN